jgi:hypothetical protein
MIERQSKGEGISKQRKRSLYLGKMEKFSTYMK